TPRSTTSPRRSARPLASAATPTTSTSGRARPIRSRAPSRPGRRCGGWRPRRARRSPTPPGGSTAADARRAPVSGMVGPMRVTGVGAVVLAVLAACVVVAAVGGSGARFGALAVAALLVVVLVSDALGGRGGGPHKREVLLRNA